MQVTSDNQVSFQVKVIESIGEMQEVFETVSKFAIKSEELKSKTTDQRIQQIFKDNGSIMRKMAKIIKAKIDPGKCKYWKEHKIVVAYDSKHSQTQAVGIIQPKYEFNMQKCSQLFFLATAYWNIDSADTASEPYKSKGAGRSIVKVCSNMGKDYGSNGEVYLQSLDSAEDYYKYKLGFEKVFGTDPFYSNVEMFLNENNAEKL